MKVRIGIIQIKQSLDIKGNIENALCLLDRAADYGADIAVLPEMFICPYEPFYIKKAVDLSARALDALISSAIKNRIYIVAGSLPVGNGKTKPKNRSIVINTSGEEVFYHDKIHLFDCNPPGGPKVIESATIDPGNSLGYFDTPWGRSSVVICYDIRFTQLFQLLADMEVKMLFVPAAFSTATGRAHWEMLVRMRALELQGFVVGVQPAFNDEFAYVPYGHSIAAGPFGEIIVDAGDEEIVKVVEFDLDECDNLRKRFPLLEHRRSDLYRTVLVNADRD